MCFFAGFGAGRSWDAAPRPVRRRPELPDAMRGGHDEREEVPLRDRRDSFARLAACTVVRTGSAPSPACVSARGLVDQTIFPVSTWNDERKAEEVFPPPRRRGNRVGLPVPMMYRLARDSTRPGSRSALAVTRALRLGRCTPGVASSMSRVGLPLSFPGLGFFDDWGTGGSSRCPCRGKWCRRGRGDR